MRAAALAPCTCLAVLIALTWFSASSNTGTATATATATGTGTGTGTGRTRAPSPAPLPRRLVPAWSAPAYPNYQSENKGRFKVTADALVVGDQTENLTIRDPRTGQVRRTVPPDPGWSFEQINVVGGRLYARSAAIGSSSYDQIRLTSYDLGTGRAIWDRTLDVGPYASTSSTVLITADGIVVYLGEHFSDGTSTATLVGVRLSDGLISWRQPRPALCDAGRPMSSVGRTVLVIECLGDRLGIAALSPIDGHTVWHHDYRTPHADDTAPIDIYPAATGTVLAQIGDTARLFDSDGRLLQTYNPPLTCPNNYCVLEAQGSDGILELGPNDPDASADHDVVRGFDPRSGQQRWERRGELIDPAPSVSSNVAVQSGGLLYAHAGASLVRTTPGFHVEPDLLVVLETSTGRRSVVPLPMAATTTALAGAAGDLLYVISADSHGPFIMAFWPDRTAGAGPTILGEISPTDWPDACALLSREDLARIGAGYTTVAQTALTLAGITWSKPQACTFIGAKLGQPVISVIVNWISPDLTWANVLLDTHLSSFPPDEKVPGGYLERDGHVDGGIDRVIIPAGRALAEVTVPDRPDLARQLAPAIARRLQAAYP